MPIDASIPLRTRTPQIQSPMNAYARALQMQNLVQQNKNLAAQGTRLQQENQARERELKGLETYTNLLRENTTVNPDGTVKTNPKQIRLGLIRGGFPDLAQKYEDGRLKTRELIGKADLATLKTEREKMEVMGQLMGPIVNSDPAERPTVYQRQRVEAERLGFDVSSFPPEYDESLMPSLTSMYFEGMTAKQQADDEFRRREQRTAAQKEFEDFYSNWLEVEGKPRNARSEMEARQAFKKLGQAPEGRTVTIGNRIYQMNPATGEYDRDIGPRPPSQSNSGKSQEEENAADQYAYQKAANELEMNKRAEVKALQAQREMDPSIPYQRHMNAIAEIDQRYKRQLAALKKKYRITEGAPQGYSEERIPTYNPSTGEFE